MSTSNIPTGSCSCLQPCAMSNSDLSETTDISQLLRSTVLTYRNRQEALLYLQSIMETVETLRKEITTWPEDFTVDEMPEIVINDSPTADGVETAVLTLVKATEPEESVEDSDIVQSTTLHASRGLGTPKRRNRRFQCQECSEVFSVRKQYANHVREVHGRKPFNCELCDASYHAETNLQLHMMTHSGELPHQCNECGKRFKEISRLNVHYRMVHEGHKPFACDVCGRHFQTRQNLLTHSRRHRDERPFGCTVCGARFHARHGLNRHLLTHNQTAKKYNCTICNKRFVDRFHYESHQSRHHSSERPFTCELCAQSFHIQAALDQHLRKKHCAQLPSKRAEVARVSGDSSALLQCSLCSVRFSLPQHLQQHVLQRHGAQLQASNKVEYVMTDEDGQVINDVRVVAVEEVVSDVNQVPQLDVQPAWNNVGSSPHLSDCMPPDNQKQLFQPAVSYSTVNLAQTLVIHTADAMGHDIISQQNTSSSLNSPM